MSFIGDLFLLSYFVMCFSQGRLTLRTIFIMLCIHLNLFVKKLHFSLASSHLTRKFEIKKEIALDEEEASFHG